jgi:hypothetical protein
MIAVVQISAVLLHCTSPVLEQVMEGTSLFCLKICSVHMTFSMCIVHNVLDGFANIYYNNQPSNILNINFIYKHKLQIKTYWLPACSI